MNFSSRACSLELFASLANTNITKRSGMDLFGEKTFLALVTRYLSGVDCLSKFSF